jgi:hypothetical protein
MRSIETQAPHTIKQGYKSIFLGGSIEMGTAELWQKKIISELSDLPIQFLNPRRDDWDSSWTQTIENKQFKEQVEWELNGLEIADIIVMVFDINTKSPISLLESGLFAKSGKLVILCPEGFWRKGNIDVVCEYYNIKQVKDFNELTTYIRNDVDKM